MKKYEAYKNSGVEWIGEIPEGWNCLPMKRGLTINNGKDYKDIQAKEGYPVIGSGGQFAYATEFLHDGEAVLLGRKGTIDKPMYINGRFWTVDTMFYAVPDDNVCCKYMFYQAQTIPFGLYSTNTALPSMTQTDLADNPMCFPPLSEQRAIASYLDHKVGQIDASVSAINTQIEDLKAYRQGVISEAVTKGLDPDASMKDSGIMWVGDMNHEWSTDKIGNICEVVTDFVASGSFASLRENVEYLREPDFAMLVRTADLSGSSHSKNKVYISEDSYNFLSNSNLFGGEIVLPNVGTIGEAYLVPSDLYPKMSLAPNSIMIKTKLCDKYYYYYFVSQGGKESLIGLSNAAAQSKFNKTNLRELKVIVPPLSEQQAIASYLDAKTAKIDTTIKSLETQRDDLNALKQSVISEAVTGKIDVRDWEPNNEQ